MKKIIQILLGVLFILVLAYISFLDVASKINDDLLSKTKIQLIDKDIRGITAKIEGEGLMLTRTLILSGTVASEKEKSRVASVVENIEGVSSVDNQILIEVLVIKSVEAMAPVVSATAKPLTVANDSKKEETSTKEGSSLSEQVPSTIEVMVVTKSNVKTPAVPVATQNIPQVPIPVDPISVPIAVDAKKMLVDEKENREIKTEGVK